MAIPSIDVRHNLREVIQELQAYGRKIREQAMVRALNRTSTTVRAESQRVIQPQLGLPAMTVRNQIRVTRATKATLKAVLTFSPRRIRLTRFQARQMADGVRLAGPKYLIAQPTWGGQAREIGLEQLRHAFIAASTRNNPNRAQNVWEREGKERYPLLLLLAPSLSDVFVKSSMDKAMVGVAQRRFRDVIAQELRFIQMKRKP